MNALDDIIRVDIWWVIFESFQTKQCEKVTNILAVTGCERIRKTMGSENYRRTENKKIIDIEFKFSTMKVNMKQ